MITVNGEFSQQGRSLPSQKPRYEIRYDTHRGEQLQFLILLAKLVRLAWVGLQSNLKHSLYQVLLFLTDHQGYPFGVEISSFTKDIPSSRSFPAFFSSLLSAKTLNSGALALDLKRIHVFSSTHILSPSSSSTLTPLKFFFASDRILSFSSHL